MEHAQRVVKNSFLLILQTLLLNFISIFATGYSARMLGKDHYGIFIFIFTFVLMFVPLTNMGLSSITIREIAKKKEDATSFLGKIIMLRLILAVIAILAIYLVINVLNYPALTRKLVYMASLVVCFQAITTSLQDGFTAVEKMQYVALANFISGLVLTLLSVLVLYLGYDIYAVTLVYVVGNFLGLLISVFYFFRIFKYLKLEVDLKFWLNNIKSGLPFFIPSIVYFVCDKGIMIVLSKLSGNSAVGTYGAASSLTDRLLVIPTAMCTAFFPAMSSLYKENKSAGIALFKDFLFYSFLLGFPIVVCTTILAPGIIAFIYGPNYFESIIILRVLISSLFLIFLSMLMGYTIGAIHKEKKGAIVTYITSGCYMFLSFILIGKFRGNGLAISNLILNVLVLAGYYLIIRRYLVKQMFSTSIFMKVIGLNLLLACFVYLGRSFNVLIVAGCSVVFYLFAVIVLRIMTRDELFKLFSIVGKARK